MSNSSEESNFFNDTFNSARDLVTERFSSPFLFSYIVSWLLIHYRVVMLIFSDSTEDLQPYEKIDLVELAINNTYLGLPFNNYIYLSGFTWALIAAIFYTFAYPFIDYLITKFTLSRKVAIRNLRVNAENDLVYSASDVRKIRQNHSRDERDYISRLERAESRADFSESQLLIATKQLEEKSNQESKNFGTHNFNFSSKNQPEIQVKLDLAKAYIEMNDKQGASQLLTEILASGNTSERRKAKTLQKKLNNIDEIILPEKVVIDYPQVDKLDQTQARVVSFLGRSTDKGIEYLSEEHIKRGINLKTTETRSAIEKLNKQKFVKLIIRNGNEYYKLDSNGLDFYINSQKSL